MGGAGRSGVGGRGRSEWGRREGQVRVGKVGGAGRRWEGGRGRSEVGRESEGKVATLLSLSWLLQGIPYSQIYWRE